MDNDKNYKNGFPKIDVTKESVLGMLAKVASFKMEERDLALDRFKRVNEMMADESEFWSHGKSAILYLDSASRSSNYLGDMAKDVMKLVFKEDAGGDSGSFGGGPMSEDDKKRLSDMAGDIFKKRRQENDKTIDPDLR